jgi:hypothetical protein
MKTVNAINATVAIEIGPPKRSRTPPVSLGPLDARPRSLPRNQK